MPTPQYTHTRCEVSFHSDTDFDGTLGLEAHPVLGSVQGVSTSKSFGNASGSFTVTLKKPRGTQGSWTKLFAQPEGSWVRINYVLNGVPQPVLWGIVDSISENVTRAEQGARMETYTVTGRDFGKALEDTKTIVNLFAVSSLDMFRGLLSAYNFDPPIGTPDKVVKKILDLWLGNDGLGAQQYRLPSSLADHAYGQTLYEALNFDTIQAMSDGAGETLDMTVLNPDQQSGQGLWDVLQQYCNGLLNEMWVDLAPTISRLENGVQKDYSWGPAFFLRERRFRQFDDTSLWDNTRTVTLQKGDVRNRQLAKGGAANRYNYWVLHGGVLGDQYRAQALTHAMPDVEPFKPGAIPIINLESMQKHGIRPYVATTNFLPFFKGGEEKSGFIRLAANWMKRIHDWYGVAPWQLSGTLTCSRLRPDIRIGMRVIEETDAGPITFYVEGVDHSWNYPGAGVTTLTVTHGEYEEDHPRPLKQLYDEYAAAKTASKATSAAVDSDEAQDKKSQVKAPKQGEVNVTENARDKTRPQPDPSMVGGLGSKDSQHANKVARGESINVLPSDEVTESPEGFTQEQLENQAPLPTGSRGTPKPPEST